MQSQRGEAFLLHKFALKSELGELIGTATANKNGLMSKIFVVTDIERGKGLIIDYKADSNGLYTSSSLIEIYVYSGANTAFYRVMSIPTGSKNIEIKYMGMHWCDFKYANSKLYVLPKSDDSSISYKVSLVRRTRPIFSTIDFSDFSNITITEYVRNCVLVVIGKPNICCIQKLYNYSGNIYKYRVKWYSNTWGNWQTVSLT